MDKDIERDWERFIILPEPISIRAKGDSLWGFENQTLIVTDLKIMVEQRWGEDENDNDKVSWVYINALHQPCEGLPYTDSGIEKGVNELLNQYLPQIKWDVKWTEQGMQSDEYGSLDMIRKFTDQELKDMSFECIYDSDLFENENNHG